MVLRSSLDFATWHTFATGYFASFCPLFLGRIWNLEMLVFVKGGKPEYQEKNPRSKDESQQQTQPTYDPDIGNQTRAKLVGGECSHHCAIPAHLNTKVY